MHTIMHYRDFCHPNFSQKTLNSRKSEEKSAPLRHPGSYLDRPVRSQAPFRLSYLAQPYKNVCSVINYLRVTIAPQRQTSI